MNEQDDEYVDEDKVCVVAASAAWPFYRLTGAYVCQENRYFQGDSGRMAFYSSRLIHGAAPAILDCFPSEELSEDMAAEFALSSHPLLRRVGEVLDACLYQQWTTDSHVQVVLLTPLDHPDTIHFEPVKHEGRTAWTMKQRYVSLERLRSASTTDDLVAYADEGG